MSRDKKPRQSPERRPRLNHDIPSSTPGKPSVEHTIGDKVDINGETRSTGPRVPLKGGLISKDKKKNEPR